MGVCHVFHHALGTCEVRRAKPTSERGRLHLGRSLLQVFLPVHFESVHIERLPPTKDAGTVRAHVNGHVSAAVHDDCGHTGFIFRVLGGRGCSRGGELFCFLRLFVCFRCTFLVC